MLKIRKEQKERLSQVMIRRFEDRMIEHLQRFFPARAAELGEAGLREHIHHGVARAASYEIVAERDVCKYIDLMFSLGRDFDVDPALPWARAILRHPSISGPTAKVMLLVEIAKEGGRRPDGTPAVQTIPPLDLTTS